MSTSPLENPILKSMTNVTFSTKGGGTLRFEFDPATPNFSLQNQPLTRLTEALGTALSNAGISHSTSYLDSTSRTFTFSLAPDSDSVAALAAVQPFVDAGKAMAASGPVLGATGAGSSSTSS